MKDTINLLTGLQASIAKNNSGLTLTFAVQGTQVSQQLQQSQTCALSDLISDAQTQAQQLATAAGLGVGNILAMSGPTTPAVGDARNLAFPSACSLTVKFALGRF